MDTESSKGTGLHSIGTYQKKIARVVKKGGPKSLQEYNVLRDCKKKWTILQMKKVSGTLFQVLRNIFRGSSPELPFELINLRPCSGLKTLYDFSFVVSYKNPSDMTLSMRCCEITNNKLKLVTSVRTEIASYIHKRLLNFINTSGMPLYDFNERRGFWRSFIIRVTDKGHAMLEVRVDVTDAIHQNFLFQVDKIKEDLRNLFQSKDAQMCNVVSLTFTKYPMNEIEVLFGKSYVEEFSYGLRFFTYMNEFCTWNPNGMKNLGEEVLNLAKCNRNTGVFVISFISTVPVLFIAKLCKKIVIVNLTEDMKNLINVDVELNELSSNKLTCFVTRSLQEFQPVSFDNCFDSCHKDICAVIFDFDTSIKSAEDVENLRSYQRITKIVVCMSVFKVRSNIKKLLAFCEDRNKADEPFVITRMSPVEMSPFTNEIIALFLLERQSHTQIISNEKFVQSALSELESKQYPLELKAVEDEPNDYFMKLEMGLNQNVQTAIIKNNENKYPVIRVKDRPFSYANTALIQSEQTAAGEHGIVAKSKEIDVGDKGKKSVDISKNGENAVSTAKTNMSNERRSPSREIRHRSSERKTESSERARSSERRNRSRERTNRISDERNRRGKSGDRRGGIGDRRGRSGDRRGRSGDRRDTSTDRGGRSADKGDRNDDRKGRNADKGGRNDDRKGGSADKGDRNDDRRGRSGERNRSDNMRSRGYNRNDSYSDTAGKSNDSRDRNNDRKCSSSEISDRGAKNSERGRDSTFSDRNVGMRDRFNDRMVTSSTDDMNSENKDKSNDTNESNNVESKIARKRREKELLRGVGIESFLDEHDWLKSCRSFNNVKVFLVCLAKHLNIQDVGKGSASVVPSCLQQHIRNMIRNSEPTTLSQYETQITWKNQYSKLFAKAISDLLLPGLHCVPKTRSPGICFEVESTIPCTTIVTNCDVLTGLSNAETVATFPKKRDIADLVFQDCNLPFIRYKKIRSSITESIYQKLLDAMKDSGLKIYVPLSNLGVWRGFKIVVNSQGEAQLKILVNLDPTSPEAAALEASILQKYFTIEDCLALNLKSLVLHIGTGTEYVDKVLFGNAYLLEKVGDFNIALYDNFFWTDVSGIKQLSEKIIELAAVNMTWRTLQIGCGYIVPTLYLSKVCREVYVYNQWSFKETFFHHDIDKSVRHLANIVASNSITNVTPTSNPYIAQGNSDDLNICVFVYNYIRETSFIRWIRNNLIYKKIIYCVTHFEALLMGNFLELCVKKPFCEEPFLITKVTSVDLSPHDSSTPLLFVLVRESAVAGNTESNPDYSTNNVNKYRTSNDQVKCELFYKKMKEDIINTPTIKDNFEKQRYAMSVADNISSHFVQILPKLVKDRGENMAFCLEKLVLCPPKETWSDMLEVTSDIHPILRSVKTKFNKSLLGTSVPVKNITSYVIKKFYEDIIVPFIERSSHPLYNKTNGQGLWKAFLIYVNNIGEKLLLIEAHSESGTKAVKLLQAIGNEVLNYFVTPGNKNLKSLVLNISYRNGNVSRTLIGDAFIRDVVDGFTLKVYGKPMSMFNSHAVPELSRSIVNLANLDKSWKILQFGAGLDAISFYLSKICFEVHVVCADLDIRQRVVCNSVDNSVDNLRCHYVCDALALKTALIEILKPRDKFCVVLYDLVPDKGAVVDAVLKHFNFKRIIFMHGSEEQNKAVILHSFCYTELFDLDPYVITKAVPIELASNEDAINMLYLLERESRMFDDIEDNRAFSKEKFAEIILNMENENWNKKEIEIENEESVSQVNTASTKQINEASSFKEYHQKSINTKQVEETATRGEKRKTEDGFSSRKHVKVDVNQKVSTSTSRSSDNMQQRVSDGNKSSATAASGGPQHQILDILHQAFEAEKHFHKEVITAIKNFPVEELRDYEKHLQMKQMWGLSQALCISNALRPITPFVPSNCSPEVIFQMKNLRPAPLTSEISGSYEIVPMLNPTTGEPCLEFNLKTCCTQNRVGDINFGVVKEAKNFMMELIVASGHSFYNAETKKGFWKTALIQLNVFKQMRVVFHAHAFSREEAKNFSSNLFSLMEKFLEFMETKCNLISLVLSIHYSDSEAHRLNFGKQYLTDKIGKFNVTVIDDMYFWPCPVGNVEFSQSTLDLLDVDKDSTVLQIGCGDGLTSLYLAKKCDKLCIFGEETRTAHILSVAKENNVSHAITTVNRKEDINYIRLILSTKLQFCRKIYILVYNYDFLSETDARLLRSYPNIKKVLLISKSDCIPQMLKVMFALCKGNPDTKDSFIITTASSVDLSPYETPIKLLYLLEHRSLLQDKIEINKHFSSNVKTSPIPIVAITSKRDTRKQIHPVTPRQGSFENPKPGSSSEGIQPHVIINEKSLEEKANDNIQESSFASAGPSHANDNIQVSSSASAGPSHVNDNIQASSFASAGPSHANDNIQVSSSASAGPSHVNDNIQASSFASAGPSHGNDNIQVSSSASAGPSQANDNIQASSFVSTGPSHANDNIQESSYGSTGPSQASETMQQVSYSHYQYYGGSNEPFNYGFQNVNMYDYSYPPPPIPIQSVAYNASGYPVMPMGYTGNANLPSENQPNPAVIPSGQITAPNLIQIPLIDVNDTRACDIQNQSSGGSEKKKDEVMTTRTAGGTIHSNTAKDEIYRVNVDADVPKDSLVMSHAKSFSNSLRSAVPSLAECTEGLVFSLESFRKCPTQQSICEKFEVFSGVNPSTKVVEMVYERGAGGRYRNIFQASQCSKRVKYIYDKMMEFIGKSKFPLYNPETNNGVWKGMKILVNDTGESMLIVHGYSEEAKYSFSEMKMYLKQFFQKENMIRRCVTSLIFKATFRYSEETQDRIVLFGNDFLDFNISGTKVKFYDDSLFWPDPFRTELLYDTVVELGYIDKQWGVVQLGCNCDPLSLKLAKKCKEIFVFDENKKYCERLDAAAKENNIRTLRIFSGSMSFDLDYVLKIRLNVHQNVCVFLYGLEILKEYMCQHIYRDKRIKKVLCVVNHLSSSDVNKLIYFCRKESDSVEPFIVSKAVPLDISPHGNEVKMIYLLVRPSCLANPPSSKYPPKVSIKLNTLPVKRQESLDEYHGMSKPSSSKSQEDFVVEIDDGSDENVDKSLAQHRELRDVASTAPKKPVNRFECTMTKTSQRTKHEDSSEIEDRASPRKERSYEAEEFESDKRSLEGSRRLLDKINYGLYIKGASTLEDREQCSLWKQMWVSSQAESLSHYLKDFLKYIVKFRNKRLVFFQDDLKECPMEETSCNKFEVFSACDPVSGKAVMTQFVDPKGFPVLVTHFHSPVFKEQYEKIMFFISDSGYELSNPKKKSGLWQRIIICMNDKSETMVTVVGQFSENHEGSSFSHELSRLSIDLKRWFADIRSCCKALSLLLKTQYGDVLTIPLIGDGSLTYRIGGYNISVHASLPPWPNISGVELLTKSILDTAKINRTYGVIQIGCGYIYVSLHLAKNSKKVVILDKSVDQEDSIVALVHETGIQNIEYICDSVMTTTSQWKEIFEKRLDHSKKVCVLINESHNDTIDVSLLRASAEIRRIIWVVKFTNQFLFEKLRSLCEEKTNCAEPFLIVRATPVDMSPFENDIKIVYLLVRKSLILEHIEENPDYIHRHYSEPSHVKSETLREKEDQGSLSSALEKLFYKVKENVDDKSVSEQYSRHDVTKEKYQARGRNPSILSTEERLDVGLHRSRQSPFATDENRRAKEYDLMQQESRSRSSDRFDPREDHMNYEDAPERNYSELLRNAARLQSRDNGDSLRHERPKSYRHEVDPARPSTVTTSSVEQRRQRLGELEYEDPYYDTRRESAYRGHGYRDRGDRFDDRF